MQWYWDGRIFTWKATGSFKADMQFSQRQTVFPPGRGSVTEPCLSASASFRMHAIIVNICA